MWTEIKGSHLFASSGNKDFPNRLYVTITATASFAAWYVDESDDKFL